MLSYEEVFENMVRVVDEGPSPPEGLTLNYGTAGFRSHSDNLPAAMLRCGVIAALRSFQHHTNATGICVTASHNAEHDNGVKIVEANGGMLVPEFETYATTLVNAQNVRAAIEEILTPILNEPLALEECEESKVVVARDTRATSPQFYDLVCQGIAACGAQIVHCGEATTPMLHWAVVFQNSKYHLLSCGELHSGYFDHFFDKLRDFLTTAKLTSPTPSKLLVDAACGVGGLHIGSFQRAYDLMGIKLEVRNLCNSTDGVPVYLNDQCGSEYVQKERKLPRRFGPEVGDPAGTVCASLDGDADRLVYFLTPSTQAEAPQLIDGDRLAVVFARVIIKLLSQLNVTTNDPLTVGIVQTAYANGASTQSIRSVIESLTGDNMGFQVSQAIAKTGVKNLHHKALSYDIAIYFESNGHGTVIYDSFRLDTWRDAHSLPWTHGPMKMLRSFLDIFNHTTGDAMVDSLAFEAAVRFLGITAQDTLALYPDLAVVQAKVKMSRTKLDELRPHPEHECWLVDPLDLQDEIDKVVRSYAPNELARGFVRPSGTEDVCRVYAEALNQDTAEAICARLTAVLRGAN